MARRFSKKEKISITIFRNEDKEIYGFKVHGHSDPLVCSAVSILAFNTVNSIEAFTDEEFVCDVDEKKTGLIFLELPRIKNGNSNPKIKLLLDSFLLGINGIKSEYSDCLDII